MYICGANYLQDLFANIFAPYFEATPPSTVREMVFVITQKQQTTHTQDNKRMLQVVNTVLQTLNDFNVMGSDQELHTLFKFSPQISQYFEHMNKIAQDQADMESSKWLRNTMATTQKDPDQTVELTGFDETIQLFNTYKQNTAVERVWERG